LAKSVLHVFATFAAGGPQVRTTRLIGALGDEWRHAVLAMDGVTTARDILTAGSAVEVLEPFPRAGTWRTVRRVRALGRELRPDLVCTYNWGAIEAAWAARSLGLPVLHHEDGFLPDEVAGFHRRRVWARALTLRGVRAVVVPSHTLERIALELWRLPGSKVHCIPNGVRPEAFPAADGNPELRAELGIPRDAFVVGSVGHLRAEKNPARLVAAVASMRAPAWLVLVGDGPERSSVERCARAAGLAERLRLAGHRADPVPWYRMMDAFALSSDTEQMPVALLEALACGLPIASTDVGDVRRMLPERGAACVVPLGPDVERRLGAALDALAADPAERAALGRLGRERIAERFTFESMVRAYRELYRSAALPAGARA
jgi:glycosyltransferase involved in cell wall biosynthesis